MTASPDIQTSDKARLRLPPLIGAQSFDPGDQSFGIWVDTDQRSQRFDVGGNPANGHYSYSEDAPNSPPNVPRIKVPLLKGAAGAPGLLATCSRSKRPVAVTIETTRSCSETSKFLRDEPPQHDRWLVNGGKRGNLPDLTRSSKPANL